MDITKNRTAERKVRIAQMAASIKQAENPDFDRLILLACSEWGVSMRVAKEYLKVAKFQNETR